MSTIQKSVVNDCMANVLFGFAWRTLICAGIGAVAGVDTTVGVVGGAVMGGFVGYEICKEHQRHLLDEVSVSGK
jgi:uncharacterized protein YcfJ